MIMGQPTTTVTEPVTTDEKENKHSNKKQKGDLMVNFFEVSPSLAGKGCFGMPTSSSRRNPKEGIDFGHS